jgi:nanoRNase/pAp phosphatase (c-di-AMP/oligoRNAs hydrolase)/rubrerythrin
MVEKLGAAEVFALAERVERLGIEFYAKATEIMNNPTAAAILRGFMQQEMEHAQTFHDFCRADNARHPSQGVIPDYLEAVAAGKLFDASKHPATRWTGNETLQEILEAALGFEKEAIALFIGLRSLPATAEGRAQIDRIIREEMQHITQLSGLLATCTFNLDAALNNLGTGTCLILTHDYPDPDALAAAIGFSDLLASETDLNLTLGFGGTIGRAENRALVSSLGSPFTLIRPSELSNFDHVALVDCQPGAGNTMVPDGFPVDVVIDHHPRRTWSPASPWTDVRPNAGSTSSIIYTYLLERRMLISKSLATALVYGIVTDTMDLGRGATPLEYGAYVDLLPRCDLTTLGRIRRPDLPREHFCSLHQALEQALVYEDRLITVALDAIPVPDFPSEIADQLMRIHGVECSFCTGRCDNHLRVSLRTSRGKVDATALLLKVMDGLGTAGGHPQMAGGAIEIESDADARAWGQALAGRLARLMGLTAVPVKLVGVHQGEGEGSHRRS